MTRKPAVTVDVRIESPLWRGIGPNARALCRKTARAAVAAVAPGLREAELAVVLADDAMLADLNRTWRGRQGPTNVLSFAAAGPKMLQMGEACSGMPVLLGDVVIAYETAAAEAAGANKPLDQHLRHLVVHGVLHLLGHDHETDAEAERMEAAEAAILREFGIEDPYRDGQDFAA